MKLRYTASAMNPSDAAFQIARFKDHLANGNVNAVKLLFAELSASPGDLDLAFDGLHAEFLAADQENLLLDLILAQAPKALCHMRLIRKTLRLGAAVNREAEVLAVVRAIACADDVVVVSWAAESRLSYAKPLGKKALLDLTNVKYLGVSRKPEHLLQSAETLADRIEVPKSILEKLYSHTKIANITRTEWERSVKTAFAIDHLTKDFLGMAGNNLAAWIDGDCTSASSLAGIQRKVGEVLQGVDLTKGMLLATFHGGFSRLMIVLFKHLFPDGVITLAGNPRSPVVDNSRYIRVAGNERGALFQALRTVQAGKVLWIGADAPFGNSKQSIDVIGATAPVADGAPFVAFETRCPTLWLALVREGGGFSVATALGPVREAGEKYQVFKDRWFAFYSKCIEDFLRGDPRNLALRPHWMQYLSGGAVGSSQATELAALLEKRAAVRLSQRGGRQSADSPIAADWI